MCHISEDRNVHTTSLLQTNQFMLFVLRMLGSAYVNVLMD